MRELVGTSFGCSKTTARSFSASFKFQLFLSSLTGIVSVATHQELTRQKTIWREWYNCLYLRWNFGPCTVEQQQGRKYFMSDIPQSFVLYMTSKLERSNITKTSKYSNDTGQAIYFETSTSDAHQLRSNLEKSYKPLGYCTVCVTKKMLMISDGPSLKDHH